jgi:lactoylglutathione lyase
MRVEHVALWTSRLELLSEFYARFFGAHTESSYRSTSRPFESLFLAFPSGARLELMRLPVLAPSAGAEPRVGLAHLAFSVGSRAEVDRLTAELRDAGVVVEGSPRTTGDGYYESVILDPDGNRIEITDYFL